jgi:hypothetical protein
MLICSPHECAYCRAPIESGQRWVREKLYGPRYHRYHADLFSGEEVSCWEKHLVQQEIGRIRARAA